MKNPHLGPTSSPTRGSIVETRETDRASSVARRLDYGRPQSNGVRVNGGNKPVQTNGNTDPPADDDDGDDNDDNDDNDESAEEQSILHGPDASLPLNGADESMQMVSGDDNHDLDDTGSEPEQLEGNDDVEESSIVRLATTKRKAGRPRKAPVVEEQDVEAEDEPDLDVDVDAAPAQRRRGRPPKAKEALIEPDPEPESLPAKRRRSGRHSGGVDDEQEEDQEEDDRSSKRQRIDPRGGKTGPSKATSHAGKAEPSQANAKSSKPTTASATTKSRTGRKRKSSGAGGSSPIVVQRGPPLPKARGLVLLHRENSGGITQTRSGRRSFKPLAYWRGEHVVQDTDDAAQEDMFNRGKSRFVLPSVKEVIRIEEEDHRPVGATKLRSKSKAKGKRKAVESDDEEELPEQWEHDPGTVVGEVIMWEPGHEQVPPALDDQVEIAEEQIAISADAILTREIRDATFRFSKTLTMPFFGSGVVDLPPGAEKRPKNSRKMQMVFFVHYGKVMVTVNETQFRIRAGGTWFVPRGEVSPVQD
jgi:centromere protein C